MAEAIKEFTKQIGGLEFSTHKAADIRNATADMIAAKVTKEEKDVNEKSGFSFIAIQIVQFVKKFGNDDLVAIKITDKDKVSSYALGDMKPGSDSLSVTVIKDSKGNINVLDKPVEFKFDRATNNTGNVKLSLTDESTQRLTKLFDGYRERGLLNEAVTKNMLDEYRKSTSPANHKYLEHTPKVFAEEPFNSQEPPKQIGDIIYTTRPVSSLHNKDFADIKAKLKSIPAQELEFPYAIEIKHKNFREPIMLVGFKPYDETNAKLRLFASPLYPNSQGFSTNIELDKNGVIDGDSAKPLLNNLFVSMTGKDFKQTFGEKAAKDAEIVYKSTHPPYKPHTHDYIEPEKPLATPAGAMPKAVISR